MASEIRVDKINSLSGVGTVTLSPTGVDIAGITTAATLRATTGIVTSLTAGSLTSLGAVSGTTGTFSGAVSGTTGTFSGAVSGTTGTFSGAVSGTTGTFTGDVDIADKIVHTGDTNTAIRFPSADTVTVETAGSERARVDSSGRLLLGTNSSLQTYGANPSLQVAGTSFDTSTLLIRRDENNANPPAVLFGKSRGSAGGNTVIQDDDQVGSLIFSAADGTDLTSVAAEIKVQIDGTPGSNDVPGRITFNTTADGAANPTERLRIDSSGRSLFSGTLGYANIPLTGNPANAAIHIRSTSKYNGIAFGEGAVSGSIGMGGADTTTAMVFVANANPANLGGGTHDTFEWHSGTSGGGGPGKYMTLDTSGDLTLEDGDLVIGTAGHGIDFSTAAGSNAGASSSILNDYEEGTCVPTQINGSFSPGAADGRYTRVGRICTWMMHIVFDSTSSSNHIRIGNFPFTAQGGRAGAGIIRYSDDDEAYEISWHVDGSAASASGYYMNGGLSTPSSAVSGKRFDITFVYEVA